MKKLLFISLFIITTILSFAWEKIELKDEFGDPTGKYTMVQVVDYFKFLRLVNYDGKVYVEIMLGPSCEVGSTYPVKMKIDNDSPKEIIGIGTTDRILTLTLNDEDMEKLKKGNKVTFVIYNTNGGSSNLKVNLNGFTRAYNIVSSK